MRGAVAIYRGRAGKIHTPTEFDCLIDIGFGTYITRTVTIEEAPKVQRNQVHWNAAMRSLVFLIGKRPLFIEADAQCHRVTFSSRVFVAGKNPHPDTAVYVPCTGNEPLIDVGLFMQQMLASDYDNTLIRVHVRGKEVAGTE